jgi:hypothetical protein
LLDRVTVVGGADSFLPTHDWDLRAGFVLASYAWGPHRISARYDQFKTRQQHGHSMPDYDDDGDAATIAYLRELGENWQFAAEWLRIHSTFEDREDLGLSPTLNETQVQLVLRYRIKIQR